MVIDERYLNDLMFLLAASNDSSGMEEEEIIKFKERIPIVLQQGKALLNKKKKTFDSKFSGADEVTWRDFLDD